MLASVPRHEDASEADSTDADECASPADDPMGAALAVLQGRRYGHQSRRLMLHANACKERKEQRTHNAYQVRVVNRKAVRKPEIINLHAKRRFRTHRGYEHRKWTETAMLAVCFRPNVPKEDRVVMVQSKRQKRRRAVTEQAKAYKGQANSVHAASRANQTLTTLAENRDASGTHVANVQAAVAGVIVARQTATAARMPDAEAAVYEISFDETEVRTGISRPNQGSRQRLLYRVRSMLMLHFTVSWLAAGAAVGRVVEYVVPPALLWTTCGMNIVSGVMERLSRYVAILKTRAPRVAVVVHSDSAKSCLRMFVLLRHMLTITFARQVFFLHCLCCMHLIFLAVNATHKPFAQLGPLFCATSLIHRGSIYEKFLRQVEATLNKKLRITYTDPPTPQEDEYIAAVCHLLLWRQHSGQELPQEYLRSVDDFRCIFNRQLWDGCILHYCPYGCCPGGRPETLRRMMQCLTDLIFGALPPIPALNRWLKLYPPIVWWLLDPP